MPSIIGLERPDRCKSTQLYQSKVHLFSWIRNHLDLTLQLVMGFSESPHWFIQASHLSLKNIDLFHMLVHKIIQNWDVCKMLISQAFAQILKPPVWSLQSTHLDVQVPVGLNGNPCSIVCFVQHNQQTNHQSAEKCHNHTQEKLPPPETAVLGSVTQDTKLELSSKSKIEIAATPETVFGSRPNMMRILVTFFTSFVSCLPPPWRWHWRSYSGIPTTAKSRLEAMLSSWRRSCNLCAPKDFVPISLTFQTVGICDNWMIPFLTASCIQSTFPERCLTFPVPWRIANWRPEDESVNITCSTWTLKINSKHRLRKMPSLRVLIIACNSLSQLDKLTTLCVRDEPNKNAPLRRCTPLLVDLRWTWFELQSLSLKLSRIQCLSEAVHLPCPAMGTSNRTQ